MNLEPIVRDYLQEIRHGGNHAETTFYSYQYHMNKFLNWTKDNGYPEPVVDDFSVSLITRYKYWLDKQGLRPRTIRGAFHPLRGLDQFMVRMEILPRSVLVSDTGKNRVALPKKDGAIRLTVRNEEVTALFDAARRLRTPHKRALAGVVLAVFCYGALRRSECLDLKLEDVNLRGHFIDVVNGKGDKSRRVYVADEADEFFNEWLALRGETRHGYFLSFDRNRRLGHEGLTELLREVKSHAHVLKEETIVSLADARNIEPHSLRHNCATNWLRQGVDLKTISRQLGHANITTTAIYLHSDEAQQEETRNLGTRRLAQVAAPRRFERQPGRGTSIDKRNFR